MSNNTPLSIIESAEILFQNLYSLGITIQGVGILPPSYKLGILKY